MDKIIHGFEKSITYVLMIIGMLLIVYQSIYLIYEFYLIVRSTFETGRFFSNGQGQAISGIFFNVLLTMEIVETVRVFNQQHINKIQIILLVGLIAVTRKILLLDVTHGEPLMEISTAVILISLGVGYFLVSKAKKDNDSTEVESVEKTVK